MTDLERQIAEIFNAPCGCHDEIWHDTDGTQHRVRGGLALRDCPICLPKRIAAAIDAANWCGGQMIANALNESSMCRCPDCLSVRVAVAAVRQFAAWLDDDGFVVRSASCPDIKSIAERFLSESALRALKEDV